MCILWAWYLVICEQPKTRPLQPISLAASPESVTPALYSSPIASRSLGIGESALRRWVDQVQKEHQGVTPQSKALTPEQQKIQELEARIARLEREKSILKKATALLMSEDHERTR